MESSLLNQRRRFLFGVFNSDASWLWHLPSDGAVRIKFLGLFPFKVKFQFLTVNPNNDHHMKANEKIVSTNIQNELNISSNLCYVSIYEIIEKIIPMIYLYIPCKYVKM